MKIAGCDVNQRGMFRFSTSLDRFQRAARRAALSNLGVFRLRLRLDEQHFAPLDPSLSQIDAEPAVAVFWMEADAEIAARTRPGRTPPRSCPGRARWRCRWRKVDAGAQWPGQDHAVFDDHVGHFEFGIEQQRVLSGIGEIRRVAAENAAVVFLVGRLRAVGVRSPVELSIDEVDAAGFVARVGVRPTPAPASPTCPPPRRTRRAASGIRFRVRDRCRRCRRRRRRSAGL